MRMRTVLAALAVLGLAGTHAQATGPATPAPKARDLSQVTPLLRVEDGTPRFQLMPEGSVSLSDAMLSQMLAFDLQDRLPVNAGRRAPVTTGEYGGRRVYWHYLVKFWEDYPNAKERPGREPRLGEIVFTTQHGSTAAPPPPAIKRVLDAQADRFRDAILSYPFIRRSDRVNTRSVIRYHRDRDPSGTEVWGYSLNIQFGPETNNPVQLPDGRWRWTSLDWMSLEICSNCFAELERPVGRYRGLQTIWNDKVLVDTLDRPVWVGGASGGRDPTPNPALYDPTRPATDVQMLIVDGGTFGLSNASRTAPDTYRARAVAATWLTDWKALVNQANGPAGPRAD